MSSEGAGEWVSTTMRPVDICGREDWRVIVPEHRAQRTEWPWWEWPRLASMFHNLKPGDVLYDVGTEEGDQSALYSMWTDHVVLIEPNPAVWANVKAIWEANALELPLACFVGFAAHTMHAAAFGDVPGLWPYPYWPTSALGPMIGDHGFCNIAERDDIDRITLDRLAMEVARWALATMPAPTPDYSPAAITIDTEGSELLVLQGAAHILTEYRPLVWVSIHPDFSRDMYGLSRDDLLDFMRSAGYSFEHLAAEHELHTFFYPTERTADVVLPYGAKGCGG